VKVAKLVKKAQSGDDKALAELCRLLQTEIRTAVGRVIQDQALVEDLCQDTYLRLLKSIKDLREPTKIKYFVAKLTAYSIKDYFRKRQKRTRVIAGTEIDAVQIEQTSASTYDQMILDNVTLDSALKSLNNELDKKVIMMRLNGKSYREIGDELEMSEASAKMRYSRTLSELKNQFRENR